MIIHTTASNSDYLSALIIKPHHNGKDVFLETHGWATTPVNSITIQQNHPR